MIDRHASSFVGLCHRGRHANFSESGTLYVKNEWRWPWMRHISVQEKMHSRKTAISSWSIYTLLRLISSSLYPSIESGVFSCHALNGACFLLFFPRETSIFVHLHLPMLIRMLILLLLLILMPILCGSTLYDWSLFSSYIRPLIVRSKWVIGRGDWRFFLVCLHHHSGMS